MAGTEDVVKTCVNAYIDINKQFLEALMEVFPECTELKAANLQFIMATEQAPEGLREKSKVELVEGWNWYMGKHAMALQQKQESVIKNENFSPKMRRINFEDKWKELDDETKEICWQYLNELSKYGQMYTLYTAVPTNMMTKIQNMAQGMAEQIKSGEMGINDLDMQSLSQRVTQEIDQDDIQNFASNMMGNMSNVGSLLNSMMPPTQK